MSPKIKATQKQLNSKGSRSDQPKAVASQAINTGIQTAVYDAIQDAKQANGNSGQEGRVSSWGQQNDQVTAYLNGRLSAASILNAKSSQANELIPGWMRLDVSQASSGSDPRARVGARQSSNPYSGSSDQRPADKNVKGINLGLNVSDQQATYPGQQKAGFQGSSSFTGRPTGSVNTGSVSGSNPMSPFAGSPNSLGGLIASGDRQKSPKGKNLGMISDEPAKDEPAKDEDTGASFVDAVGHALEAVGEAMGDAAEKTGAYVKGLAGELAGAVVGSAWEIMTANRDNKADEANGIIGIHRLGKTGTSNEYAYEQLKQVDLDIPLDPEDQRGPTAFGQYLREVSGYNRAKQAGRKGSQGGTADGTPVDGRGDTIVGQFTGELPDRQQMGRDMFGNPGSEGWSQRPSGDPTRGTNWGASNGAGVVRPGDDGVYSGRGGRELDPLSGNPPAMGIAAATAGPQNVAVGTARNDVITGQSGARESLEGKAGADRFRFGSSTSYGLASADRVIDFSRAQGDRVEISRQAFGLRGAVALSFAQVVNARELATALGSSTLFIQDLRDGSLLFNQNGSAFGAGSGGVFAQFTNGVALQASDLSLIA